MRDTHLNNNRMRNSVIGTINHHSDFEPPPPYTSPHSTLVAVRTSAGLSMATLPRPRTSLDIRPSRSTHDIQYSSLSGPSHPPTISENISNKRYYFLL